MNMNKTKNDYNLNPKFQDRPNRQTDSPSPRPQAPPSPRPQAPPSPRPQAPPSPRPSHHPVPQGDPARRSKDDPPGL